MQAILWERWDEWDKWDKWEIPIERSVTHRAKRYPSSVSTPIYPIKRGERVLKGNIFYPLDLLDSSDSYHEKEISC